MSKSNDNDKYDSKNSINTGFINRNNEKSDNKS